MPVTLNQAGGLTIQLIIVLEVHKLVWVLLAADEAVLVGTLHVLVQLVPIIEALLAEAAQRVALEA